MELEEKVRKAMAIIAEYDERRKSRESSEELSDDAKERLSRISRRYLALNIRKVFLSE